MLAVFLSALVSTYIFVVIGFSFAKIYRLKTNYTERILIGLVVSNIITTIISLFSSINILILVGFFVLCLILNVFIIKEIKQLFEVLSKKKAVILYSLPFIFVAFVLMLKAIDTTDFGLYHLQSIKWIEAFPVVPGLANLHGRFGFNPNIFTLDALTTLSSIFNQEIFTVNFVIFVVYIIYYIDKLREQFLVYGVTNAFLINFVMFLTILSQSVNISTPTPDFISITTILFVFARFYNISVSKCKTELSDFSTIIILCAYVLTVKLAALPIMLLPLFILIQQKSDYKVVFKILIVLLLIFIPWMVRNVILSGWLVYPFPAVDLFNFDWKVPLNKVIAEKSSITSWARDKTLYSTSKSVAEWFPFWWNRLLLADKLLFSISILSPLVSLFSIVLRRIKPSFSFIVIWFVSFSGVLFWFNMAPDIRFGKGFIVIASVTPLLFFDFKVNVDRCKLLKPAYLFSLLFFVIALSLAELSFGHQHIGGMVRQYTQRRLITPEIMERSSDIKFKTFLISGTTIYAPVIRDKCLDHCIPCTPYPDTTLVLRNKTLRSGFKVSVDR